MGRLLLGRAGAFLPATPRNHRRAHAQADFGPVTAMKKILSTLLFGLVLFTTACSDSTLQTLAKAMPVIATANQGLFNIVTSAVQSGVMTADEARPIVQINQQVAQAGIQIDAAIKGETEVNAAQKVTLLQQIAPVQASVTAIVSN